ncbi:MAG: Stp1/IreP family PP2C-type Ser/Thr phosphatase [Muribaculaceae bacterium]
MENYIIANYSDVGRVREINEDSMVTFDSPNGRVVAVCDGMGGQAGGEVASQLACTIIRDILENNTFDNPDRAITAAITAANQGILHRATQDASLAGMGATCVIIIYKDTKVHFGWVGDSRIYYVANHTIRQISKDQSYVQQLLDRGLITPEQAVNHPQKNEITNALGLEGMTPPEIGTPITPAQGSVFLLCSDGLTGMVDDQHIERIVSNNELSLAQRAHALVEKANANGGLDNITVQLVQFTSGPKVATDVPAKKKRYTLIITLSAVLAAAIAGAGAWYVLSDHGTKVTESSSASETSTSTSSDNEYNERSDKSYNNTRTEDVRKIDDKDKPSSIQKVTLPEKKKHQAPKDKKTSKPAVNPQKDNKALNPDGMLPDEKKPKVDDKSKEEKKQETQNPKRGEEG